MGLATCCPDMVDALLVFHPLPLLHHFFCLFCFSLWKFAFDQCLLLSVVSCQSPSAFVLLQQIRLGSYEVPLTGHWPQRMPPALCLSHYRTCKPLQLLLAQQLGLLHVFLRSSALTLLSAKSFRVWIIMVLQLSLCVLVLSSKPEMETQSLA